MDRITFEAMARRRGYTVDDAPIEIAQKTFWLLRLVRGQEEVTQISVGVFENRDIPALAIIFDQMVNGQHHMACSRCKEPLLRCLNTDDAKRIRETPTTPSILVVHGDFTQDTRDLNVAGTTMYYIYRSAKAGPASPMLLQCVQCNSVLDIGTTEEIVDEDATAKWLEAVQRKFAGTWDRRELIGDFLEDALPEEEERPEGTTRVSFHTHWNMPTIEGDVAGTDASMVPGNAYGLLSPAFLESKVIPDQPNDILLETVLARIMTGGVPHTPIDPAQILREVEARQWFNEAIRPALNKTEACVKEEARLKKQRQQRKRQARRNRAQVRRRKRG